MAHPPLVRLQCRIINDMSTARLRAFVPVLIELYRCCPYKAELLPSKIIIVYARPGPACRAGRQAVLRAAGRGARSEATHPPLLPPTPLPIPYTPYNLLSPPKVPLPPFSPSLGTVSA